MILSAKTTPLPWPRPLSLLLAVFLMVFCDATVVRAQDAALSFDGQDDFVLVTDPTGFSATSNLTVEAWIRPRGFVFRQYQGIVDGFDFVLFLDRVDNSVWGFSLSPGRTDSVVSPADSLVLNRWDHLAGTYDGTTMRLYQNGTLVAQKDHESGGSIGIEGDVTIGLWVDTLFFEGDVDEVRIWNVTRSESEIQQFVNQPLTGMEAGLIGYWRLDEGSGQSVMDQSSQENDGTLGLTLLEEADDPTWIGDHTVLFADGFEQ